MVPGSRLPYVLSSTRPGTRSPSHTGHCSGPRTTWVQKKVPSTVPLQDYGRWLGKKSQSPRMTSTWGEEGSPSLTDSASAPTCGYPSADAQLPLSGKGASERVCSSGGQTSAAERLTPVIQTPTAIQAGSSSRPPKCRAGHLPQRPIWEQSWQSEQATAPPHLRLAPPQTRAAAPPCPSYPVRASPAFLQSLAQMFHGAPMTNLRPESVLRKH